MAVAADHDGEQSALGDEQTVTKRQLEIMRHALGPQQVYRNHFVTGAGSDDYEDCEELVRRGYMEKLSRSCVPSSIYVVTPAGREIVEGSKNG